MRLKYKLPLIIFNLLIIFMLAMGFYMYKTAKDLYHLAENKDFAIENEIITRAISKSQDLDTLLTYFQKLTTIYNTNVIVYGEDGRIVYHLSNKDIEPNTGRFLSTKTYIINKDFGIYKVILKYPIVLDIKPLEHAKKMQNVIIIGLFILFILIGLVNYIMILHPLNKIRKKIQNIHYENMHINFDYEENNEIGFLCKRLEEMGERLEKSYSLQNDVITDLSCDINIPLITILQYVKELSNPDIPLEESKKILNMIFINAKDIENALNNLEDYFRYEDKISKKQVIIDKKN